MSEEQKYEIKIKERKRMNVARRGMAKAMLSNWNNIPMFVQMTNANAANLMKLKKELQGVSYNDIIIKCVANAVKEVPQVNSTLIGDDLVIYEDINISVAVISEYGLFVPVIRNTDKKDIYEISAEVKTLAEKAATGKLTLDDMAFGTLTVSNLGATAVENGTPILNAPQGALAFIGTIRKEPVVNENDEIVVGNVIGYSVGYDHRFLDGMAAQAFTSRIKKEIETVTKEKVMAK